MNTSFHSRIQLSEAFQAFLDKNAHVYGYVGDKLLLHSLNGYSTGTYSAASALLLLSWYCLDTFGSTRNIVVNDDLAALGLWRVGSTIQYINLVGIASPRMNPIRPGITATRAETDNDYTLLTREYGSYKLHMS